MPHEESRVKSKQRLTRVGLIGLGLEAYWNQFQGLRERLLGYVDVVSQKIAAPSRVVVNLGLIDSPEKALDTGHACRRG